MKHFIIDTAPPMSNGLMIAALAGPQDVALSATTALKHLMQRDEAVTFAQADPDGLFIYNNSSPTLKRDLESGLVTIVWPQLELHHAGPGDEPGPVFLTGWRPQIGMHGLIDDLGEIAEMCGVRNMIHLTSGYGDQPHTRPTIISALATTPHENPELYEITMSLGKEPNAVPLEDAVLMQACLVKDMGYLSVCGHVSRYLGMIPDYQVAADLARNIQKFTRSAGKPLEDLEQMESEFRKTVEEAVASNPLLASIVAAAEQAENQRQNQMETGLGDINPEEMALEVEQFPRAEQWIKEGKYALNWTRLSCHKFVANQVRLELFVLAYNLGNFMRRLALPEAMKHWSLTSLQTRMIKTGGRLVRHARRLVFQLAEVLVSREMLGGILERIGRLRLAPG